MSKALSCSFLCVARSLSTRTADTNWGGRAGQPDLGFPFGADGPLWISRALSKVAAVAVWLPVFALLLPCRVNSFLWEIGERPSPGSHARPPCSGRQSTGTCPVARSVSRRLVPDSALAPSPTDSSPSAHLMHHRILFAHSGNWQLTRRMSSFSSCSLGTRGTAA